MLNGKRIFVSGGAGVIGQVLVDKLHGKGATIFVGDLKPRPRVWHPSIIYRQGDLNYITQKELADFAPEIFFHLAATFERSIETYDFWEENYHHNIRLSHYLMTILKDLPSLRKVIFASSYLVYDSKQYYFKEPKEKAVRLKETDSILPRNLTGAAKLFHEIELDFLTSFPEIKFEAVSARIYRSYGRDSRDVISRWIKALLQDKKIDIYREEGLFDYIYADEVAEGLLRLTRPGTIGVANLGNDNARRVKDVVSILENHFPNLERIYIDSDIPYEASQADMNLFRDKIGWVPSRQLEDVIPELIRFGQEDEEDENDYQPINVLVTSISKKAPLLREMRKALNKIGAGCMLYGGDLNPQCLGRYFVDGFWCMPAISELDVKDLISYCHDHDISVIIPTRDGELLYFAIHCDLLEQQGIRVMISPKEAVETCNDKLAFYEVLHTVFPIIPTTTDIHALKANSYVVKERYGAGARSIGLDLSKEDAIRYADGLNHPVFQPFVVGDEYSVDLYIESKGRTKGVVTRTRDVIVDGESQITTTVRNPKIEKLCHGLAEHLHLRGHQVFQVLMHRQGNVHLLECNPRFGGASTLSVSAGLDSFYWFLLESIGEDIKGYPFFRAVREKRQIRFAKDIIVHA